MLFLLDADISPGPSDGLDNMLTEPGELIYCGHPARSLQCGHFGDGNLATGCGSYSSLYSSRSMATTPLVLPVRRPTLPFVAQARASSSVSRGASCQPLVIGTLPFRGVKDQPRPYLSADPDVFEEDTPQALATPPPQRADGWLLAIDLRQAFGRLGQRDQFFVSVDPPLGVRRSPLRLVRSVRFARCIVHACKRIKRFLLQE